MNIYTDGGCSLKRGLGSFGIFVPDHDYRMVQLVKGITNNEAELMGFIAALKYAQKHPGEDITIVTDSLYVKDGYEDWMYNWHIPSRKNAYLWQMIWDLKEVEGLKYPIRHCRGHGKGTDDSPEDVYGNDVIDKLVAGVIQNH